jgi:hypothetical protein
VAGAAAERAEAFQAHLIGLSVSPPVMVLPTGVPGVPDTLVVDERAQIYRRRNPAMKAAFGRVVNGRRLTSAWRDEDAAVPPSPTSVSGTRAVDLIVAAQSNPHWPDSPWLDMAERLAVEAGRRSWCLSPK